MATHISAADYRALAEVRYRIRCFLNFSEGAAREAGVEPQQHQLLLAMRGLPEGDEPTIGKIAERLQIAHNSAVELVRRSVERGLVEKTTSVDDRRVVHLAPTAKGDAVLEGLSRSHRSELRAQAPALLAALELAVGGAR